MASPELDNLVKHLFDVYGQRPQVILGQTDEYISRMFPGPDGWPLSLEKVAELKAYIVSPVFRNRPEYHFTIRPEAIALPPEWPAASDPQQSQRVPRFPLSPKLIASSLFCARQMASQIIETSPNLDICFCIDGTTSMKPYIAKVKESIIRVSQEVESGTGMIPRFALVVYRDYEFGPKRKEVYGFMICGDFQATLARVSLMSGKDMPEDCFGGLWAAATEVQWRAPARILLWMGDAPQHGPAYNAGFRDDHPNEPGTPTSAQIFKALHDRHIILVFCKLTNSTDRMIAKLKEESKEYGANNFLEYSVQGEVGQFLTKVLNSTVSMTVSHESNKPGPEKIYKITPATWEIDNFWGPEEEAVILTSLPYEYGRRHPLLDLLLSEQAVKDRSVKCRFTLQPVERGEMRIAYRAIITENDSALPQLFGMAKESRYEGNHNSRENLTNQAKIQALAAFLAAEFTIKLRKIWPECWCRGVEYIPVEIIRLPNRPDGKRYLSYETFLPGDFLKFNGNNGYVDKILEMGHWLPQAFSHFTYIYSDGMLLVSDLQGVVLSSESSLIHRLTDPAVHTADANYLKDPTNLGPQGIQAFFSSHVCNDFCTIMQLPPFNRVDPDSGLDMTDVRQAIQVLRDFTPTFHP